MRRERDVFSGRAGRQLCAPRDSAGFLIHMAGVVTVTVRGRQGKTESASLTGNALNRDLAAQPCCNAANDRETQSMTRGAGLAQALERREEPGPLFICKTSAIVAYPEVDTAVRLGCRAQLHRWRYVRHPVGPAAILQRIADVVDPHFLDPWPCLLYTSDAADDLLCVDLGG